MVDSRFFPLSNAVGSTRREGGVPTYVNLSASSMLMIAMQYTTNPGNPPCLLPMTFNSYKCMIPHQNPIEMFFQFIFKGRLWQKWLQYLNVSKCKDSLQFSYFGKKWHRIWLCGSHKMRGARSGPQTFSLAPVDELIQHKSSIPILLSI